MTARRGFRTTVAEVSAYRELLVNLTQRELRSRYRRTFLGWAWSFMQPVLMTLVYALVLGTFLGQQPPPGIPSGIDTFVFFLLTGVIPWGLFANGLNTAVGSVANAGPLITRVWFPREVLPISTILALCISTLIELSVVVLAITIFEQVMLLQFIPVILFLVFLQVLFTTGFAFWLSACNVKFKDVEYLTSVLLMAYFYITPVLYSPVLIPNTEILGTSLTWRELALANPMARFMMAYRNVMYDVRLPGFETMVWLIGWSIGAFLLGLRFFARRSERFAEAM